MVGVGAQDRVRRGEELGIFSLKKMRQRQCLITACSCLMGEGRKGGVRLLLEVPRGRMTGSGHKSEQEKIQLDVREQFSPRGSSNSGPGAQRACGISILGDIQTLAGGDSEKPILALMSSGVWAQAICPVLHGDGLGVKRSCCRHVSSAPSSG